MWWWYLYDIHPRLSLTYSFVSNNGDDFYSHWWDKLMICNYIYSNFHSFVANGPYNYCIKLWLILRVSLMKLLWKFLMLVLSMNYLDWIVKKEKSTSTFGLHFSYFGPFWTWGMTSTMWWSFKFLSYHSSPIQYT